MNCSNADTAIWNIDTAFPQIWSLCNVGATQISISYSTGANDNPLVGTEVQRGKYFQWGEDVVWDYDGGLTSDDNCIWDRDTQLYVAGAGPLSSWIATVTDTIDESVNGTSRWGDWSMTDTRGPCASGYHVPTGLEWNAAYSSLGTRDTFVSTLRLPMAGGRHYSAGSPGDQGGWGRYSSSTPSSSIVAYKMIFDFSAVYISYSERSFGYSVRCRKN